MSTSDASALLASLAGALADLGVRWYLFGAQAVLIHGRPRLTEDVHVTVALGELTTQRLVEVLDRHGFGLPATSTRPTQTP